MNIHRIYSIFGKPFRKKRMAKFLKLISPKSDERILDVGGSAYNWELISCKNKITLLNLDNPSNAELPSNLSFVVSDGTDLPYKDKEYDIVFSNSVIEHVGSYKKQKDFAQEVCRVGKRLWIQTPAKSFIFEPHYLTPFIHWLPRTWQKKLLRNFTIWGLITRPTQQRIDDFVDEIRLLNLAEIRQLFPGCTIIKEKFLFMTKAYLVVTGLGA